MVGGRVKLCIVFDIFGVDFFSSIAEGDPFFLIENGGEGDIDIVLLLYFFSESFTLCEAYFGNGVTEGGCGVVLVGTVECEGLGQ